MSRSYEDLSKEELIKLLQTRERRDATRFGLVWEANEIERDKALNSDFVALDLDASLSCGKESWRNLIIEGDNFDALRYLRMCFAGRVKCIYIDPPYNTGNKDFVYNDHFVDKEDLWRHSKWCEFMYQRLSIAKDLLREDGSIFVSIDDNELFSLGLLMNKVFGEGNFVANILWQKRYSTPNDHKTIAPLHDYILVYQAHGAWQRNALPRGEEKDKQYRLRDEKGIFRADNYTCNKSAEERPTLYYPITQPNTGEEIWPKKTAVWRYSPERHQQNVEQDMVYWGKDGLGKVPAFKRYKHLLRNADGVVPSTWWPHQEVGHNDEAKKELMSILWEQDRSFSTPKPTRLIDRILQIGSNDGDIILDFFAGSGTTAHSVLKMNQADEGNRRFILVSSTEATDDAPDKNICRDVCAERVRRVSIGYKNAKGEEVEGLGGDFAYLRCRKIPASKLLEIEHSQVWTALQLLHRSTLTEYKNSSFLVADDKDEDDALIYVPRFNPKLVPKLREAVKGYASVVIYSWQPGLLRQHIRAHHVQHEAIPESLARRFGMKA
jgi:adenine-specific DNA-methyltransferase